MNVEELTQIADRLVSSPGELEWVEFKRNVADPEELGEYLSAISNAAALHGEESGFLVWGVEDETHRVVGTTFRPRRAKVGNEELESWLARLLTPRIDFRIYEFVYRERLIVLVQIPAATHQPTRFQDQEFIRVGTNKKKLKDYPEKERSIWSLLSKVPFEREPAERGLSAADVLGVLDYPAYFELTKQPLPENRVGIIERLQAEKFITPQGANRFIVTNLGAILFAKRLDAFQSVTRKSARVISYDGVNRTSTQKEFDLSAGYAAGFERLLRYIVDQLPQNEVIGQALRREVRMYPALAIRELVANALIHQDLRMTGTGPMVEIFSDRIEMTNPGAPLIDPLRFIDEPPRSRNEILAGFMRRVNVCEERGSGIDKVILQAEMFQLPAPDFSQTASHTKAVMYSAMPWASMDRQDRIRGCYQHACLQYVSNHSMTNASLRKRFGISAENYSMISRLIADTAEAGLIRPHDPANTSRRHARYVPFWV